MPPLTAIWIRHGLGKVFHFQEAFGSWSVQEYEISDRKALFHTLATALKDAESVLLLGPDLAKYQFRNHLVEQFPLIARRLAGCEAMNAAPNDEIADWVQRCALNPVLDRAPVA